MKPQKILIFSFVYYPRFIGGAEVAIKEITDRIASSDISFDLIALRLDASLPRTEKIGNVTVHRIGFSARHKASADSLPWYLHLNKYVYPFLAASTASRLHKERAYDGIWAMMANYSGFGAFFFKIFHTDVPFLLTLQEGDPIEYITNESFNVHIGPIKIPVRFALYPIFRMIFKRADRIQTISQYLADFARNMGAGCAVDVVPNAVDTKLFSLKPSEDVMVNLKKKLHKSDGDVFLITTSRLVVKNAVNDIISSLPHLPENVKFLILGVGYEEGKLKALAHKLGVKNRVQFLGYVPHHDMPQYLHISDIFIRPSISEGFGNSFVEAMAADIPVIATPVGGIVDFLKDGETGLFCAVKDPESIAIQVKRLLEDSSLRQQIILNARKMVFEKYDWNHIALQMKSLVFAKL